MAALLREALPDADPLALDGDALRAALEDAGAGAFGPDQVAEVLVAWEALSSI